jgi:hypothetical protein
VRPLSAEELTASLRVASNSDLAFKLGSVDMEYAIRFFGEPNDGQGNFQGSLAEHLFLNNAGQIRTLCQPRKGNLGEIVANTKLSAEERVDRLFLSVLSRPPSLEEKTRFIQHLNGDPKMASQLAEEAIWVLLSCSEFRFNR